MVYSTVAMVKERLEITDATWDTHIANKQTQATNYIDTELAPYVATLPLTGAGIVQSIMEIEADIAAGLWKEEHEEPTGDLPTVEHRFTKRGKEALERYIITTYKETKRVPRALFKRNRSANTWETDYS